MSLPELILLRAGMLPDVPLRPGTLLHGRVLDARTLVLEGARLAAELPDDVEPGDVLRLTVAEAHGDRLHLRIAEKVEPPAPPLPPPLPPIPLPGGAQLMIDRDGAGRAPDGSRTLVLRFDAPRLGRMDFRIERGGISAVVAAAVAQEVRDGAPALRERVGVPVSVQPRGVDVAA